MSNQRTHYVTTSDGVTVGATVHGHGPTLVFLHGALGDGDLDWDRLVAHLAGRFTCHLPSLRGRGLSGDHPNQTIARNVEDMLAYVDSIGEPTGLVGLSGGANHALAVAAQADAVTAVVPFEPVQPSVMDETMHAALGDAVATMAELAAAGRLAAAARAFAGWPFNDEEVAWADETGYFEAAGRYVPNLLKVLKDLAEHGDPTTDPGVLGAIHAPVVVLYGSETKPVFAASARYVADQVPNGRVQEIAGTAHAAPLTHPGASAEALTAIFAGDSDSDPVALLD